MFDYDKKRLTEIEADLNLVNMITKLMETDKMEEALPLIHKHYKGLTLFAKKLMTVNIIEATKQYDLRKVEMPEDFYDFLASHDSDELFFPNGLL